MQNQNSNSLASHSLAGSARKGSDGFSARSGPRGPSLFDSLTEMPRILFEITGMTAQWSHLIAQAPKGQPHPVMVLPGFSAGDDSTLFLRRFLNRLGYKPLPWLQGMNTGSPKQLEAVMLRFYKLQHALGTPISLVGQSLGGVYSREIAKQFPEAVRSVITLGSPYAATGSGTTNPMVEKLFERLSGMTVEEMRAMMPEARDIEHLPMPATSVYSKQDGVVAWQTCIEPESALSENIRIYGSHSGMAMNPDVLRIIADRLAQNPTEWQPFDRNAQGCGRLSYPSN